MPRDSSGNYTLPAGNPVVTGSTIASSWANTTLTDIATEMTDSLDRSGKGGMLAAFKITDGSVGAPGLAFASEIGTGLYRIGAAQLGISVTGTEIVSLTPSSITWNTNLFQALTNTYAIRLFGSTTIGESFGLLVNAGSNSSDITIEINNYNNTAGFFAIFGDGHGELGPGGALSWSASGQWVFSSPTISETCVAIEGASNNYALKVIGFNGSGDSDGLLIIAGFTSVDAPLVVENFNQTLTIFECYGDGEVLIQAPAAYAPGTGQFQVGYLDAPPHVFSASGSLVFTDRGKSIEFDANNIAINIPANSSVAFPLGTVILFYNIGFTGCTLTCGDTLIFASGGVTGTRTVASYAFFTLMKVNTTQWIVGGTGLS